MAIVQGNTLCMKIFKHVRALKERKNLLSPFQGYRESPAIFHRALPCAFAIAPLGLLHFTTLIRELNRNRTLGAAPYW